MDTPHRSSHRRSLRALCALGFALAALVGAAQPAGAYVTPAQAEHAAERGVSWFQANQAESGSLGSDWAMTAMAATGLNAADVRTSLLAPTAQAFYLGEWRAEGPGGAATDAERAILAGVAGGIQTSRLSASPDAAKSNLVARVAELFDGTQIGSEALLNDDIFGVLALHHAGAPPELLARIADHIRSWQLPDGGWSWSASAGSADTDITGSVVASMCTAGVPADDPDVREALDLLGERQDPETGGFLAPPPFGVGVNTDSTAWVASGLVQCGIDPQGPEWTTASGETPLDYLVSMQRPDGRFDWTDEYTGGAFETYSSVRPLMGVGFSAPAPERLDGASPAVRPAPDVADGTTVPITLVIDHGDAAEDVRMCRVDVESGTDLGAALGAARDGSTPAGCVDEFEAGGGAGGIDLASLNGVAEAGEAEWRVAVDGSEPATVGGDEVGFGDLVFLEYGTAAAVPEPDVPEPDGLGEDSDEEEESAGRDSGASEVPPLGEPATQRLLRPRVAVRGRALWAGRRGMMVRLRCPAGNGAAGCRGVAHARFRPRARRRARIGGRGVYRLRSGTAGLLWLRPNRALHRTLARRGRVAVRLVAATRAEDGSVRMTRAWRFLAR